MKDIINALYDAFYARESTKTGEVLTAVAKAVNEYHANALIRELKSEWQPDRMTLYIEIDIWTRDTNNERTL